MLGVRYISNVDVGRVLASTISTDLHESFKGHVKRWMLRATTSGVPLATSLSTGLSCFPYMWMSVPWPLLVRTARLKVRGCELLKYQRRAYPTTIPRPPNPKPSTQNPIEVFLAPNFPIVQSLIDIWQNEPVDSSKDSNVFCVSPKVPQALQLQNAAGAKQLPLQSQSCGWGRMWLMISLYVHVCKQNGVYVYIHIISCLCTFLISLPHELLTAVHRRTAHTYCKRRPLCQRFHESVSHTSISGICSGGRSDVVNPCHDSNSSRFAFCACFFP